MLSQLTNIQNILSQNLEYGMALELRMAGFNFKRVNVDFKASTITDDLKIHRGNEIKIRNLQALYNQGIISQETYAFKMGYDKPDEKEPRMSNDDLINDAKDKENREKDKDKSDRKVRDKKKPQGTTKPK